MLRPGEVVEARFTPEHPELLRWRSTFPGQGDGGRGQRDRLRAAPGADQRLRCESRLRGRAATTGSSLTAGDLTPARHRLSQLPLHNGTVHSGGQTWTARDDVRCGGITCQQRPPDGVRQCQGGDAESPVSAG